MSLFFNIFGQNQPPQPPEPLRPIDIYANMLSEHYRSVVVIVSEQDSDGYSVLSTLRGSPFEAYGLIGRVMENSDKTIFGKADDEI